MDDCICCGGEGASELTEESVWLIVRGRGSGGIDLGDKSLQSLDL